MLRNTKAFKFFRSFRDSWQKIRIGAFSDESQLSFSQEGEDLVILRQIPHKSDGFYIEVGALDPRRFSNTWAFHSKGWRGILIEPNPDVRKQFNRMRPGDVFINEGISLSGGRLTYHKFREPALNTFDPVLAQERRADGWAYSGEESITTRPLKEILNEHVKAGIELTLMSVDVEGMDEEVLRSNDWEAFRPEWLIVEVLNFDWFQPDKDPIISFLYGTDYCLVAKTGHSVILRDKRKASSTAHV